MTEPVIYIREEAFGCGFDVLVLPQRVSDDRGWEFRERSQAVEWAEKLGHEHGWCIVDQTGGGT